MLTFHLSIDLEKKISFSKRVCSERMLVNEKMSTCPETIMKRTSCHFHWEPSEKRLNAVENTCTCNRIHGTYYHSLSSLQIFSAKKKPTPKYKNKCPSNIENGHVSFLLKQLKANSAKACSRKIPILKQKSHPFTGGEGERCEVGTKYCFFSFQSEVKCSP